MEWIAILQSETVFATILSVVLTALLALLAHLLLPRGRLKWSVPHFYSFLLPTSAQQGQPGGQPIPSTMLVRTADVWVQNAGRAPVTGVEIIFNYRPQHYELYPQRAFTEKVNPDGRLIIQVDSLGERECFTIAMIDGGVELPEVVNIRSDLGVAKKVMMGPMQIFPTWANGLALVLMIVGVLSLFFWTIRAIQLVP
jgi:hypothetical protein